MVASRFPIGARSRPGPQSAEWAVIPAFVGGVNAQQSVRTMQPDEMLYAYNIVPSEYGLRTRRGTREWARGITPGLKTIIPFHGLNTDFSDDRLFVCSVDGIWNATTQPAAASQSRATQDGADTRVTQNGADTRITQASGTGAVPQVFSWTSNQDAGYGVYTIFQNDAGALYILYADSVYGLHVYTAATDTWAAATGITGLDVAQVRFVTVHKQRVWLILEDSPDAYYLPIRSIAGAATKFVFGANLPRGGDLVGLFNWTRDGGDGVDDYLLAIGRGGDVTAWRGEDPGQAFSWANTGIWNIGPIPAGRRVATDYGGEVYILSSFGVISAGELFRGKEATQIQGQLTTKITRLIRDRMATDFNVLGWELLYHPQEGELILNSPTTTTRPLQYVQNVTVSGWGFWRDLPMTSFANWRNELYSISPEDGKVWVYGDNRDNILLGDANQVFARDIEFSLLSSYQDMGHAGSQKFMEFLRPVYISSTDFPNQATSVSDYQLSEIPFSGGTVDPVIGDSEWDVSNWDQALWGGLNDSQIEIQGSSGIGVVFAVALQGSVRRRASLISVGAAWRYGSFL